MTTTRLLFLLTIIFALATDAEAQPLYVSSDFGHAVLRYDRDTGAYTDTLVPSGSGGLNQPHAIIDRGTDLLVASFGTDQVLRYDRDSGAFLGVFISAATGLNDPVYMRYGPDGNLYVSSQASDEILRFTPSGVLIDAFIPAGSGGLNGPSGFAFGSDGRLYVAGRYSANVIAYDGASGAFVEIIADSGDGLTSGDTFGLNFGDNGDLYVASNGNVFRYDFDAASIIATIPRAFPIGIEPGPEGDIFVASSNNLYRISTADNSVTGPFLSGGSINLLNFFHFPDPCRVCPGDMDASGQIDSGDLDPFVDRLLADTGGGCADVNLDGEADGLDIAPFVARLLQGLCQID